MKITKLSSVILACACFALLNGCVSEQQYKDLKIQNDSLSKRKAELESELQTVKLDLDQLRRKLETAEKGGGIEAESLRQKVAALEKDIEDKKALIASMQQQLLGGSPLPVELNTMLEDFAKGKDLVTYDASRGVVKFKSDLLFAAGSDEVAAESAEAVKALCAILNSEQGKNFDIIIAGHTDDLPIAKTATRELHPTNWHLSAHRAIAVLDVMAKSNISSERMSIRGFSEFRPLEPNKPNKSGNPVNRRVEIYIVHKGM